MTAWLVRNPITVVESASPADMEAQYGGVWHDAEGNGITNALGIWQPDLSFVTGWPVRYWYLSGDSVLLLDVAARAAVDAQILSDMREAVTAQLDNVEDVLRAFMLATLDEMNGHAAKMNAILSAIDACTSISTLKTNIGAVTDYPSRSTAQMRTAVRNKLGL